MDATYVKVSDLRPGIIISEDVFANTRYPIIRKNVVINANHLEVLEVFGIKKVKVESVVVKKEEIIDNTGIVNPDEILSKLPIKVKDIVNLYTEAVHKYKSEFSRWQVGIRPDIAKIRSIIIPLVETFMEQKKLLLVINDQSDLKNYMYHHSVAVGLIASAISKQMGFPHGQTLQLGLSGVLADCGMAKIDIAVTEKTAFLTKDEYNEVKKHTIYSYQMVQDTPFLRQEMKLAIFQHHERLDGSGYPRGSRMEEISVYSQILAVADVFHAMTSERIYRPKESPFKVIEMIREEEFGKFNLKVVEALQKLVGNLSIGTKVRLTNGKEGEVLFVHQDALLRPIVRMHDDQSILDLIKNRRLFVDRILS